MPPTMRVLISHSKFRQNDKNFMKTMKQWSKSIGLITSLLFISFGCNDSFLDVPVQNQQPAEQFWQSEADVTKAVNAMYGNMRSWAFFGGFAAIAIESLGSDDTEKGSDPSDAAFMNNFDVFTATSTDGQTNDFWTGQYQEINLCNQVLDNIGNVDMDAALAARYIGEAKFIRAYSYFRLVRAFGDVPLRLNAPKTPAEYNIPRTPKAEVWQAIEQDLIAAAAALPTTYGAADKGRATKGAALALHAKAALYQAKWNDVLTLTNQVMGLGYTLFPDFEKQFRIANENNSESIFEIQCTEEGGNQGISNSQHSNTQGVRGDPKFFYSWGFNVPTQSLVDAFEAGDPRMDATILFRGETTPQGDLIALSATNPMYNQKTYVPSSELDPVYWDGAAQNIRVMRYAEVLLMNAEANNELGNSAAALASLELVRARARAGNNAILPQVVTTVQSELRNAIYHERHVELAMEYDRYFDVIRQGRGLTVFGPKGWKANKNEVWPIPQVEIDKSEGLLTQNSGY
jgi:starch-binding outer membrane protein, SusD/RagB family